MCFKMIASMRMNCKNSISTCQHNYLMGKRHKKMLKFKNSGKISEENLHFLQKLEK